MINIKSIWENQKPSEDIIIKTKIEDISNLDAFAATNQITGQQLLILSVSKHLGFPELKNYRFKGVEIFTIDALNNVELHIYLLDNELKDIFLLFIQNIIEDIKVSVTETDAIIAALSVITKWKRLFDKINFNGLSLEEQKGLLGELLFLNYLLNDDKTSPSAVRAWTAGEDEFRAKDFTFGSVAIEIKFTSAKQPQIRISNERQLDAEKLNQLYLVLYSSEAVKENGISLNSIVDKTRQNILNKEELHLFNSKLLQRGYLDNDKEYYNNMYSIKDIYSFSVNSDFPKIVKHKLPLGIYDISYSIEISAVEDCAIEFEKISTNISQWKEL